MDEQKRNDFLGAAWALIAVMTLISLWTYTPHDIPFEVSLPNSPIQNWCGPTGAYLAWFLLLLFGRTAYILVPLFLFWALSRFSGKKGQALWLKILSSAFFVTSACAIFALLGQSNDTLRFQFGGIIGFFVSIFLSHLFGRMAMFVALSFFILSVTLATELLLLQMTVGIFERLKKLSGPALAKKTSKPAGREVPVAPAVLSKTAPPKIKIAPPPAEPPKPAAPASKLQIKLPPAKTEEPKKQSPASKAPVSLIQVPENASASHYQLPPYDLLQSPVAVDQGTLKTDLEESSRILEDTLRDFGIDARVVEVEQGPTITRYELQPAAGVKVQKITSLENDIALAMRAASVRIVAPIPGKSRVGIEVPNIATTTVYLKEVLTSPEFQKERSKIAIAIGKDTAGAPLVCNLADMPHLLIAGATNTGKSVCINSILMSLLFRSTPEEVKFLIIDPKMVELHFYNDLPHLICPVITDKSKTAGALAWLIAEMERRYRTLSKVGAKNILGFNEKVENKQITSQTLVHGDSGHEDEPIIVKKMPYIVLVIDELADLMLASAQEVETGITRLAQLARAVGIHMILATQRPSVDIITGVIKANFPARIAFQVASKVDSRTILDENGADKLLGRGDLLMMDPRKSKVSRAQGAWVQDSEIEKVTNFIRSQKQPIHHEQVIQAADKKQAFGDFKRDEVYEEAKRVVLESGQASVSMVQRRLGLGYTRAARLMDMMEEDGVVGPYRGAKPREILVERPKVEAKEEKETA